MISRFLGNKVEDCSLIDNQVREEQVGTENGRWVYQES
jgi:hypothetical protein